MTSRRARGLGLAAAGLLGLALRLHGIGWDGFTHQNPDERFLTLVAASIRLPGPSGYLDTARSPANPLNAGHSFYVYGTLPLFLFRGVGEAAGRTDYEGLLLIQRLLAILADTATILLVGLLAARLAPPGQRRRAGLAAALLWALTPFAIQQARFGTVDTLGTAFALAALVVAARASGVLTSAAAGLLLGAAAACKVNLLVFSLPAGLLLLFRLWRSERGAPGSRRGRSGPAHALLAGVVRLAALGGGFALAFRLGMPYAFRGPGLLDLAPDPSWLEGMKQLASLLRNETWFPPGIQWVDRVPVLELLSSLFLWGTGPVLGVFTAGAAVTLLVRGLLKRDRGALRLLPALGVFVPLLVWQGFQTVASVRHAHATLAVLVATALAGAPLLWGRRASRVALGVVAGTVPATLAFLSITGAEHTRVEASRRIAEVFPGGATIGFEYWDDALPLPVPGVDTGLFTPVPLPVFEPDAAAKSVALLAALERCDAIVLSSRRGLGTLPRIPDAYPRTAEYYRLLWSGALGFERVFLVERRPGLGPFRLDDRGADEALSVYDHPSVALFRKTPRYSPAAAALLLGRVDADMPPGLLPGEVSALGVPPDLSPQERAKGWPAPPPPRAGGRGAMGLALARWLLALELAGVLGFLLARPLGLEPALAAGLARPLGWVVLGLLWLWLGHFVPGYQSLGLPLLLAGATLTFGTRRGREAWRGIGGTPRRVFLGLLFLFLAVRSLNPEIYLGEKPMDAALLGAALRAPRLPLPEPWFAGAPLDYYGQGFLAVAALARTAGAWPGLAYNLAVATLPALLGGALFAAGRALAGSAAGGAATLVLGLLSGTLAPLLNRGFQEDPLGFWGFWSASRVAGEGIHEFPLFSALWADLHAHLHGWAPLAGVLLVALGRLLAPPAPGSAADRGSARLLGLLLAGVYLTNPWDAPLAALLAAAALSRFDRRPSPWEVGSRALAAFGTGLLVALPSLLTIRGADVAFFLEDAPPGWAALRVWAELHGVLLALLAVAWVVRGTGESRGERVGFALGLGGAVLLLLAETVTISDRMNTVFKLGLQARLLLALGAGVAVPALVRMAALRRRATAAGIGLLAGLALVTVLAGGAHLVAVARTRWVPGPRPTLDGFAYVPRYDPPGAVRMEELNRRGGIPTIFDPPGAPYTAALETTMRTGCPTLVGWPWHLRQRRRSPVQIALREADVARLLNGPRDEVWSRLVESYGLTAADVPAPSRRTP